MLVLFGGDHMWRKRKEEKRERESGREKVCVFTNEKKLASAVFNVTLWMLMRIYWIYAPFIVNTYWVTADCFRYILYICSRCVCCVYGQCALWMFTTHFACDARYSLSVLPCVSVRVRVSVCAFCGHYNDVDGKILFVIFSRWSRCRCHRHCHCHIIIVNVVVVSGIAVAATASPAKIHKENDFLSAF